MFKKTEYLLRSNMKKITSIFILLMLLATLMPQTTAVGENVKSRYQEARERYQDRVEAYRNSRERFVEARNLVKEHRNKSDPEANLDRAKDFLMKSTDAMIGHLEIMRVRIENTNALGEDEKENILAKIDSYIQTLEDKKGDIDSAGSMEELREIAKGIKDEWNESRSLVKEIAGKILTTKLDRIIEKGEGVSTRIDEKIDLLKDQGKDTTELEELRDDYNSLLEKAKDKNNAAKEKFEEINDLKDADQLFREAHGLIKEANSHLKEAFRTLKEIVRTMRELNKEGGA